MLLWPKRALCSKGLQDLILRVKHLHCLQFGGMLERGRVLDLPPAFKDSTHASRV